MGCGMCAAVCPKERLEIRWNPRGEYSPIEVEGCADCSKNCQICYKVCPAHGNTPDETEIGKKLYGKAEGVQYKSETGYYLSSYVGYSKEHRATGASGGMASWTLEALLASGKVEAVATVGRTKDPDKLFEFRICHSVEEIRASGRSAYYPVEVSQVMQYILNNEGRYAVIGLPCVCKAIRLAQDIFPKLKRRIPYVLGLTCGHQCSKFFAEYICALGGGDPHELREMIFRTKDLTQPASNLGFLFHSGCGSNEIFKQVLWRDGVGEAFANGFFQIPGCFYCDDVFAECADIAFMDAWLPEYKKQPEGHSIILIRNTEADELIGNEACGSGKLKLSEISIKRVMQSQLNVINQKQSLLFDKKDSLSLRYYLYKKPMILQSRIRRIHFEISDKSSIAWNFHKKNLVEFNKDNDLLELSTKLSKYKKYQKIIRLPMRISGRIQRACLRI